MVLLISDLPRQRTEFRTVLVARAGLPDLATNAGRIFQLGIVPANPIERMIKRHWSCDAKTLDRVTSQLRQKRMFAHGFDTFDQSLQPKTLRQGQNGADKALLLGVSVCFADEGPIDFDPRHTKPQQCGNRRVFRPKVVKINPAAEFAKPVHIPCNDIVGPIADNCLQDHDRKAIWGQVEAVEFPADLVDEAWIPQFAAAEIHAHTRNICTDRVPGFDRCQGMVEGYLSQSFNKPSLLKNR